MSVMALLVLLTGCGQTADSEPPEPENVPDVPTQEEPAPPEPVLPEELQAALERARVSVEDIAGRQLIVVCADGDAGQLLRFEADGQLVWTQVGDAVEARVGQNGVSREKTEGDRKTPPGAVLSGLRLRLRGASGGYRHGLPAGDAGQLLGGRRQFPLL